MPELSNVEIDAIRTLIEHAYATVTLPMSPRPEVPLATDLLDAIWEANIMLDRTTGRYAKVVASA
jgi:hypothetical protein